jgi:histidine triad (HIT) family protein
MLILIFADTARTAMDNCLFCKIAKKGIPAKVVYEDETILAFEDIHPKAPTHVLIIPKDHYASLNDVPEDKGDLLSHILIKARQIARDKGIAESGYRIVLNTARDSGQEVFHIHFHLLGGRKMSWPPG